MFLSKNDKKMFDEYFSDRHGMGGFWPDIKIRRGLYIIADVRDGDPELKVYTLLELWLWARRARKLYRTHEMFIDAEEWDAEDFSIAIAETA